MIYPNKLIIDRFQLLLDNADSQVINKELTNIFQDENLNHSLLLELAVLFDSRNYFKEAILVIKISLLIEPGFFEAYLNLGRLFIKDSRISSAVHSFQLSILLQPNDISARYELAKALLLLGQYIKAKLIYETILDIEPNHSDSLLNLALIKQKYRDYPESINLLLQACSLNDKFHLSISDRAIALEALIFSSLSICDWSNFYSFKKNSLDLGIKGEGIVPLGLMALEDEPRHHLIRAQNFSKKYFFRKREELSIQFKQKIKIAYFSAHYFQHATMNLMIRIFELYNREKFEVYVFSYGTYKPDFVTNRVKQNVDFFYDINNIEDREVVDLVRKQSIDIAIDLMGYTDETRISIFSYGIAPIQITYLGYPGTLGSNCFDYLLADSILIPKESEKFYSEKIIRMPFCYQCNDDKKVLSSSNLSREIFDLPINGFVFACFNANYKITPHEFDIWMRLLNRVNGSVLWLLSSNKWSSDNLRREAIERGIDADRIIFAPKVTIVEHLNRHKCADLFLDTFNYNAHTTASDALATGLPIVTKIGKSFSARVCASLLNTLNLTELITSSPDEYENLAYKLAVDRQYYLDIKLKLIDSVRSSPLFDSQGFVDDLEGIFEKLISN